MRRLVLCLLLGLLPLPALAVNLNFGPSCSQAQAQEVLHAFNRAATRSRETYMGLNKPLKEWPQLAQAAYLTWFGPYDQHRLARVGAVLDSVQSQLNNPKVSYDVSCMLPYDPTTGNGCQYGDYAESLVNQRHAQEILFCDGFFGARPYGGYDSQWGVVLHEVSHTAANTEDHSYSTVSARNLPPGQKVDNADNYEYFFETLYYNAGG